MFFKILPEPYFCEGWVSLFNARYSFGDDPKSVPGATERSFLQKGRTPGGSHCRKYIVPLPLFLKRLKREKALCFKKAFPQRNMEKKQY